MKKILLFILSLVVGIALFIGVIVYIGVDEIIAAFQSFSWSIIAVVVVLSFIQVFITIYRWKLILEAQGDRVPFRKLIAPKFVGYAISFLTPGLYVGGEPVRAFVLKKQTGTSYSHGFASIIVDKILDFTYPLPFLIAALVYAIFAYDLPWGAVSVFVLILFILIIILGIFYIQTYRGRGFFSSLIKFFQLHRIRRINRLLEKMLYFEKLIITFFNHRQTLFIKGLLISLLGGIVILTQFTVILYALGVAASFWQILVMMVFMILSFLIPIPASLGAFETGQVVVFAALKHTTSAGVAFTLILRTAEILKVGLGLIFLSNLGLKFLKEIPKENELNNNHLVSSAGDDGLESNESKE